MTIKIYSTIFALVLIGCFLVPGSAATRKHHHHTTGAATKPHHAKMHVSQHNSARAKHLARLAAKEKAEWRNHLAKLRAMPRSKRIAMKRHDRRLKQQLEQIAHEHRQELLAHKRALANRHQLASRKSHERHMTAREQKIASRKNHHAELVAAAFAARQAHWEHLQAIRNARLAHRQEAYEAHLRNVRLAHAQRALKHETRLAQLQADHNARIASQRAHWVAMHGDDSGGHSIQFMETVSAGIPVKVITVDLNDPNVKVSALVARFGSGSAEPFHQMIERANPNVAVTGTFFSLDNLKPVGDIVIDGELIHFGGMGTALCVTPNNHADMVTCEWGRHHDWSPYDFVVACGPRLLQHGRIVLDPKSERFKDRHMLAPNSRIAVGITPGNKIVFAMTREPIYLGRLAKVMRGLGTVDAMNLDAGTSTGFYYNGTTLAKPGRQLTNMIVVYGRKERYERALDQLIPVTFRRADTHSSGATQQRAINQTHPQISELPKN